MKKTMITVWAAAASLALAAGIVEDTKSRPVLAGTAQIAPFGEVTQKVTTLGTLIGNPIVPTMLLSAGQQQLVDKYGRLRADAPITCFAYIQTPAWEVAATNLDQVSIDDMLGHVLVYPSADSADSLMKKHPGATKDADGTIHILPGESNPNDTYVKFTPDGRYCAIASSQTMAAKALDDFAALSARRKGDKDSPMMRIEIVERGVTALSSLYASVIDMQQKSLAQEGTNEVARLLAGMQGPNKRKAKAMMDAIESIVLTLDMDKSGFVLDGVARPKPGRKAPFATDFALPKGSLDNVPASAPLFYFIGDRLSAQCSDEASFRADMAEIGDSLEALLSMAAANVESAKFKPFLKDVGSAFSQMLKSFPFPGAKDWTGLWLAFDDKCHPRFEGVRWAEKTAETRACSDRFAGSIVAAVEKLWPGKRLLVKDGDRVTADLAALVDQCGAEVGVKPGDDEAKELEGVKKNIESVLGSCKLASVNRYDGNMTRTCFAALGIKPPAPALTSTGEARVAAALPEVVAKRPAAVFSLDLYTLARNVVLPIMAKVADKDDAKQYKAIIAAMPPPEANSTIAAASWADANGSFRSMLRITAGEIKNLGAAFNAFTAASLAGGADND